MGWCGMRRCLVSVPDLRQHTHICKHHTLFRHVQRLTMRRARSGTRQLASAMRAVDCHATGKGAAVLRRRGVHGA